MVSLSLSLHGGITQARAVLNRRLNMHVQCHLCVFIPQANAPTPADRAPHRPGSMRPSVRLDLPFPAVAASFVGFTSQCFVCVCVCVFSAYRAGVSPASGTVEGGVVGSGCVYVQVVLLGLLACLNQ